MLQILQHPPESMQSDWVRLISKGRIKYCWFLGGKPYIGIIRFNSDWFLDNILLKLLSSRIYQSISFPISFMSIWSLDDPMPNFSR